MTEIGANEIARTVSQWTGIPIMQVNADEGTRLLKLEEMIGERIVGQQQDVKAIAKAMRRGRAGIQLSLIHIEICIRDRYKEVSEDNVIIEPVGGRLKELLKEKFDIEIEL